MTRITVFVDPAMKAALIALAAKELRDPRYQAAKIIRDELTRRGLIPHEQTTETKTGQALQPAHL